MTEPIINQWQDKTIIIFGLGKEGLSTYRFLYQELVDEEAVARDDDAAAAHPAAGSVKFLLIDEKPLGKLQDDWAKIVQAHDHTYYVSSVAEIEELDQNNFHLESSLLFKAPGIPATQPQIVSLIERGATLYSNTQLFFELSHQPQYEKFVKIIGVTGTKGKSTTTAMIHHVLTENGIAAYLAGNIGEPALDVWQDFQTDLAQRQPQTAYFVLELSSHQLAELTFSPHLAVVQNIVSEHLDYYEDFNHYFEAKSAITRYQSADDLVFFNQDSTTATQLANLSPGYQFSFSIIQPADGYLDDEQLAYQGEKIIAADEVPLPGNHNIYNTLPAIMIGRQLDIPAAEIGQAIKTFQPLPHRLEFVTEVAGVKYFNDSIATNPEASKAAIESFQPQPIILLAGGYERNQDFSQLVETIINHQVKAVALFPPTGARLQTMLQAALEEKQAEKPDEFTEANQTLLKSMRRCDSMAEAVEFAASQAKAGEIVLLSPAAASFGLFENYQERGRLFAKHVQLLAELESER